MSGRVLLLHRSESQRQARMPADPSSVTSFSSHLGRGLSGAWMEPEMLHIRNRKNRDSS